MPLLAPKPSCGPALFSCPCAPFSPVDGRLTIICENRPEPVADPHALALAALGWVLADEDRAQRFLALTGLTPDGLRSAIGEPATHRAVFDFLSGHEPDLVAAAEELQLAPEQLVAAGRELSL